MNHVRAMLPLACLPVGAAAVDYPREVKPVLT